MSSPEQVIADNVERYGWHAISIGDVAPPFVYTVGLMQTIGQPEAIIFGLEPRQAHAILSWELTRRETEHTILHYGLGDAIARIGRTSHNDMTPIFEVVDTGRFELIGGAFRAMALLRMVPSESEIIELIRIAELPEAVEAVAGYPNDPCGLRLWVAAAAAG